jgi:hypothetical protein
MRRYLPRKKGTHQKTGSERREAKRWDEAGPGEEDVFRVMAAEVRFERQP